MTTEFPVASERFEEDPPVVALALDQLPMPECDGSSLVLTPDRADELAAALTSNAAAARAGLTDIAFTEDHT